MQDMPSSLLRQIALDISWTHLEAAPALPPFRPMKEYPPVDNRPLFSKLASGALVLGITLSSGPSSAQAPAAAPGWTVARTGSTEAAACTLLRQGIVPQDGKPIVMVTVSRDALSVSVSASMVEDLPSPPAAKLGDLEVGTSYPKAYVNRTYMVNYTDVDAAVKALAEKPEVSVATSGSPLVASLAGAKDKLKELMDCRKKILRM